MLSIVSTKRLVIVAALMTAGAGLSLAGPLTLAPKISVAPVQASTVEIRPLTAHPGVMLTRSLDSNDEDCVVVMVPTASPYGALRSASSLACSQ